MRLSRKKNDEQMLSKINKDKDLKTYVSIGQKPPDGGRNTTNENNVVFPWNYLGPFAFKFIVVQLASSSFVCGIGSASEITILTIDVFVKLSGLVNFDSQGILSHFDGCSCSDSRNATSSSMQTAVLGSAEKESFNENMMAAIIFILKLRINIVQNKEIYKNQK